jgi:hypothetical protein
MSRADEHRFAAPGQENGRSMLAFVPVDLGTGRSLVGFDAKYLQVMSKRIRCK